MDSITTQQFETIMQYLLRPDNLTQLDIVSQFCSDDQTPEGIARNLNAVFLIVLSGKTHPLYQKAITYFEKMKPHGDWKSVVQFYMSGIDLIHGEIRETCPKIPRFSKACATLYEWLNTPENLAQRQATIERFWQVFFPEGCGILDHRERRTKALREKRTIRITNLQSKPITRPVSELLFTSNVLLTLPTQLDDIDSLQLSEPIREHLKSVLPEKQCYWFDHPVQIGINPENNEVIYGLRGLHQAYEFEQQRGNVSPDETLTCILSVSVTHQGLHTIARPYLEEEFQKACTHSNGDRFDPQKLNVYVFTEVETQRLIDEILLPAAEHYLKRSEGQLLHEIIGVDGEYGRHYTFLKAVAAFWHVFIDPQLKGTFKIDLDQVFPQKELVEQSGVSAFEHFQSPLWGAEGVDYRNQAVELGMIAGALVNENDISRSLFTPDVTFLDDDISEDRLVFFSKLPQALSTEAEMMTRYAPDTSHDGVQRCVQRIHITGGTNGILVNSLRKFRPFTPTFIGRAEDQCYLLSVLFKNTSKYLRYVHQSGLIMRHDKEVFAAEAIKSARLGTLLGDYIRLLWFSYYARALPWDVERIKDAIDPFTGSFVSHIPVTLAHLRFVLRAAAFFAEQTTEGSRQGYEFITMGTQRLREVLQKVTTTAPNFLVERYQREQCGWDLYYDILDAVENALRNTEDEFAHNLRQKARHLIQDCQMHFTKRC